MKDKYLLRQKFWHSIILSVSDTNLTRNIQWTFPEWDAIVITRVGFRYTLSVDAASTVTSNSFTFGSTETTPVASVQDSLSGSFDSQISNQWAAFGRDPIVGAAGHEEHLELELQTPIILPRGSRLVGTGSIALSAGTARATLRPYINLIPVYNLSEINEIVGSM